MTFDERWLPGMRRKVEDRVDTTEPRFDSLSLAGAAMELPGDVALPDFELMRYHET